MCVQFKGPVIIYELKFKHLPTSVFRTCVDKMCDPYMVINISPVNMSFFHQFYTQEAIFYKTIKFSEFIV